MNQYSDKLLDEHGEYYIGWTNNTHREFYVDAEDYDKVKNYNWYESYSGTTITIKTNINSNTTINGRTSITMHQLLGFGRYDHSDKNELNNRKYNLRKCSHQQNCCNRSIRSDNTTGFTGVYFVKKSKKWRAQLNYQNKTYYGLSRETFEEAKIDRLQLEAKYMKEFSPNIDLFEKYNIKIDKDNISKKNISQVNTSGCTGVTYDRSKNKWQTSIRKDGHTKYIGRFKKKKDAIIARLNAEIEIYGYEMSPQRHLFEKYNIKPSDDGKETLEDILENYIKDESCLEEDDL